MTDLDQVQALLEETVAKTAETALPDTVIGVEDDLFDLGLTSLGFVRVMAELNAVYGTSLNGSELEDVASVRAIARALADAVEDHAVVIRHAQEVARMDGLTAGRGAREFALSPEELESFRRNGYFGPFTVYEPEEMTAIWKRERLRMMDRSAAVYPVDGTISGNTNIANYDRHLDVDFLADHICRPRIVDRVVSALGPDVLCWRTEFFPKYPGDEGTDWHQADTFANASGVPQILWPEEAEGFAGTITVWTAFTEASEQTGCLQFIPGSHTQMNYDETKRMHYDPDRINSVDKGGVRRGFFGYDYRELQKDPDWKPDESRAVSMVMRPGQAIMFWSTLMHASLPHSGQSREQRLGFAGRYVPTSVRVYPDTEAIEEYGGRVSLERYGAVLVAGEDKVGHNRLVAETTRGHRFGEAQE